MEELPDYYEVLGIKQTATSSEIRDAYKLRALETHPDRYPIIDSSVTREEATKAFQKVADAYYVLSNPQQKEKYVLDVYYLSSRLKVFVRNSYSTSISLQDDVYKKRNSARSSAGLSSCPTSFSTSGTPPVSTLSVFYSTFTSPDPDALFGNIFEELLRPEVDTPHWFYSPIGTIAGGILGFIIGNLPGLILGAYLGGRLGSIRDAKGKKRGLCVTGKESSNKMGKAGIWIWGY
ncbi:8786_t:CDS:2 [Paraglomus brasilianum]|uniref:8786_t:CDS:1 n=1 Tax=Paraglomus brasilianum TaxID=144538 RepID=A0A9N9CGZ7_9GLOM|nr:8786_t:CDS:2 [Paraglomus brasilianum]